jgi:hypothetical protein
MFAPIDKTIDLAAMAGRQKGNDGPEKGRAPVSIATSSLPDGGLLPVDGAKAGVLQFENKSETADCYVVSDSSLAHDLFGTSPLIGNHGRAIYDATSVKFFETPASTAPFISGSKAPGADLWHLQVRP